MIVTVLGSGTAVPVPDRFPAGYFVESGDTAVMIDCGPGTLRRLVQAGGDIGTLDGLLLTHYHTDHCADLAALLFARRSPHFAGCRALRVYGAPGLRRLVEQLTRAWPWLQPRGYELALHEITPGTFQIGEIEITAVPIRHTAQSLGYRLTGAVGTAAFSGDADCCDELIELARDVELFVCDCAAPDGQKIDGHLTPGLAGTYAERAGARVLVLTHFYPECDGHNLSAEAARRYHGQVILAEDLMRLDVGRVASGQTPDGR